MTKSTPKWKRKGYQTQAEYSAACRANKKTEKAALLATKTENTAYAILRLIWDEAEFDKPECTITKEQIMAKAKCSLDTVKDALKELRDEGSLKPIYIKGGRGIPAKYRLSVAGQAHTPSDEAIDAMQDKRDRDAAWRFLKNKYGPLKALEMMGGPEREE